ncbi:hypothetical protein AHF37_03822 [Paragonimus kellicotti]|nr:hypothetical protein AHF37_03822 [Paragonimus kellicotti]
MTEVSDPDRKNTSSERSESTSLRTVPPDALESVTGPGRINLILSYSNVSFEVALKELLPHHVSPISGFTVMGHVAHFNLKPDALPYRHLIVDSSSLPLLKSLNIDVQLDPCPMTEVSDPDRKNTSSERSESTSLRTVPPDALESVTGPGRINLILSYSNVSFEVALKELLPHHVSPISGFTVMGHVAHFNLKPDALPYRHLIGQLVLDKLPHIRTVIHKAAVIESDYRNFQLDLMAGEPNYVTTVKENNLTFHLSYGSVLGTEHARIVDRLCSPFIIDESGKPTTIAATEVVVYDVFAGVGPFAVPAARLGCRVFANDLNPDSYQWLLRNVQENRSKKKPMQSISCTNMDGRAFIRQVLLPNYWKTVRSGTPPRRYVTLMNLPALAPDFLDAFVTQSSVSTDVVTPTNDSCDLPQTSPLDRLPLDVFCYCFLRRNEESEETIKLRIAKALGATLSVFTPTEGATTSYPKIQAWSLRFVRNVAPYKDMFCAEFQLFLPPPSYEQDNIMDPATKRPRTDNVA